MSTSSKLDPTDILNEDGDHVEEFFCETCDKNGFLNPFVDFYCGVNCEYCDQFFCDEHISEHEKWCENELKKESLEYKQNKEWN